MTNEQKITIKTMREKLCSYAEIAEKLRISVNSVKSYCLRNHLNTEVLVKNAKKCKNCGKPIVVDSRTKPRVFCSNECKVYWWKNHKSADNSNFVQEHTCTTCGKSFSAYTTANRKYCSLQCYQRRNFNG